jgi:hypothetical protein
MFHKKIFALIVVVLLLSACGGPSGPAPEFTFIGGTVWLDNNGNGLQDAGEAGVEKVTVNLFSATGSLLEEQFTGGEGNYQFGELNEQSAYSIQVVLPSGYSFSTKDVGSDDDKDSDVFESGASIGRSDEIPNLVPPNGDVDAGLKGGPAAIEVEDEAEVVITGFVWLDANGNGQIEALQEEMLAGVEVTLLSTETGLSALETVKTDSLGIYTFSARPASGEYLLFFDNPPEYAFTMKDVPTDDVIDSDVWPDGPNLGHTDAFDLADGAPDELAAGLIFAAFTPEVSEQDVTADFTAAGPLCFEDMLSTLSLPFHIKFEAPNVLILSSPADGSTARGTIERDGQFHLVDEGGYGTWDGLLNRDLTGTATNKYLDSGCTTLYEVQLILPN